MTRRRPSLNVKVPKMAHGDAERMYDFCVLNGLDPVPWQFELLRKWESASMDEQFGEIVKANDEIPRHSEE